jgi:prepilin signal peptidase PulO-like enzyme (type II secretory pathway)
LTSFEQLFTILSEQTGSGLTHRQMLPLAAALLTVGLGRWVPRTLDVYGARWFDRPLTGRRLTAATWLSFVLAAPALLYFGLQLPPFALPGLAAVLVALVGVVRLDLAYRVIPDRFHLAGGLGALALFYVRHPTFDATAVVDLCLGLGAVTALTAFTLLWAKLRKRDALGMGDLKLLAWLAVAFGLDGVVLTLVVGLALAAVAILPLLALKVRRLDQAFAFGPYLAAGAVVALLQLVP